MMSTVPRKMKGHTAITIIHTRVLTTHQNNHQSKRINATLRQRTRELAKLDKKAAEAGPTGLIPGLEEQINVPELDLGKLSSKERRQLSADQQHWERRLETIEAELSSEPQRIVDSYRVVTHRLEPAGLVYLWPISG